MPFQKLLLLFFSLSCFGVSAQDNPLEKNELDKLYTPDKNSIFFGGSNTSSEESSASEISNAIKFYPSLLLRSTAAIFYERKLGSAVTVQPGIGFAFNKDLILTIGSDGFDITGVNNGNDLALAQVMAAGIFKGPSLYTALSVRFYLDGYSYDESFNSGYFEMNYRYNPFKMSLPKSDVNDYPYIEKETTVSLRSSMYLLTYGFEFHTEGKIKTTHDFFLGGGIRTVSYNKFVTKDGYVMGPYGMQSAQVTSMESGRTTSYLPCIVCGYAFGFGF